MVGHLAVDVVGRVTKRKSRPAALDLPRQIGGINGQAVATDAGAGQKREAERFRAAASITSQMSMSSAPRALPAR